VGVSLPLLRSLLTLLILQQPQREGCGYSWAVELTFDRRASLQRVFSTRLWFAVHTHLHLWVDARNVKIALQLTSTVFPLRADETGTATILSLSDFDEVMRWMELKGGRTEDETRRALTAIYLALEQGRLITSDSKVVSGIDGRTHGMVMTMEDLAAIPLCIYIWAHVLRQHPPHAPSVVYQLGSHSTQADMFLWYERLVTAMENYNGTDGDMKMLLEYLDMYSRYYKEIQGDKVDAKDHFFFPYLDTTARPKQRFADDDEVAGGEDVSLSLDDADSTFSGDTLSTEVIVNEPIQSGPPSAHIVPHRFNIEEKHRCGFISWHFGG